MSWLTKLLSRPAPLAPDARARLDRWRALPAAPSARAARRRAVRRGRRRVDRPRHADGSPDRDRRGDGRGGTDRSRPRRSTRCCGSPRRRAATTSSCTASAAPQQRGGRGPGRGVARVPRVHRPGAARRLSRGIRRDADPQGDAGVSRRAVQAAVDRPRLCRAGADRTEGQAPQGTWMRGSIGSGSRCSAGTTPWPMRWRPRSSCLRCFLAHAEAKPRRVEEMLWDPGRRAGWVESRARRHAPRMTDDDRSDAPPPDPADEPLDALRVLQAGAGADRWLDRPLPALATRDPVSCPPDTPLRTVLETMHRDAHRRR